MRIDSRIFSETAESLYRAGGGSFGSCKKDTDEWGKEIGIPAELLEIFKHHIPKSEIWAGAGVLFDEDRIVS